MTDQHHPHLDERDRAELDRQRAELISAFSPPVEAEVGEPAEAVDEEDWSTIVRFRNNPLTRPLEAGTGAIPPAPLLEHLDIALGMLELSIRWQEARTADNGTVTNWATLSVHDAARLRARIGAVRDELIECFERQAMLDTSAHADNLPF